MPCNTSRLTARCSVDWTVSGYLVCTFRPAIHRELTEHRQALSTASITATRLFADSSVGPISCNSSNLFDNFESRLSWPAAQGLSGRRFLRRSAAYRFSLLLPTACAVAVFFRSCGAWFADTGGLRVHRGLDEGPRSAACYFPLPVSVMVWNPFAELSDSVSVAVLVPFAVGVNFTVMVQVLLPPSVAPTGQVLVWLKSPALVPLIVMLLTLSR